ncbi:MAG: hypothetical protein Q8K85_21645, partial [Hyphomicrobium sp.]|nr:hypothetical protein [Hyphomicrobium sp.]
ILAGADDQPRGERPARNGPRVAHSPTPDKMHDFERIAIRDRDRGQSRPRDNLQITLDRDPCRVKPDFGDHGSDGRSGGYASLLAIDSDYEGVGCCHIV